MLRRRFRLAGISLILILSQGCTEPQFVLSGRAQAVIDSTFAQIEKDVTADSVGGITVVFAKGQQILATKGFGLAVPDSLVAAEAHHIYRIGSISKSMTAAAMMILIQDGVFKLDDPVESVFPEIKTIDGYDKHPAITFRQMASHTAGLILSLIHI